MKIWKTPSGYDLFRVLAGRSNVFLLTNNELNILIDTGIRFTWRVLDQRLKKLGVRRIDYLVLTHSHFDHAANAFLIRNKYKARVIIHSREAEYLNKGRNHVPGGTGTITKAIISLAGIIEPLLRIRRCESDILIDYRHDFTSEGFNAYLIYTPGHSPGSMSLIIDNEIALVGDCMIGSFRSTVFPPFADNVSETLESWRKLLQTNCSLFIPSHGNEIKRERVEKTLSEMINS